MINDSGIWLVVFGQNGIPFLLNAAPFTIKAFHISRKPARVTVLNFIVNLVLPFWSSLIHSCRTLALAHLYAIKKARRFAHSHLKSDKFKKRQITTACNLGIDPKCWNSILKHVRSWHCGNLPSSLCMKLSRFQVENKSGLGRAPFCPHPLPRLIQKKAWSRMHLSTWGSRLPDTNKPKQLTPQKAVMLIWQFDVQPYSKRYRREPAADISIRSFSVSWNCRDFK